MFSQDLIARAKCSLEEKQSLILDAKRVVALSCCASLEGILSLEEYSTMFTTEFSKRMLRFLIDSYDVETIIEMGIADLITNSTYSSKELFRNMIFLLGIVDIARGVNPHLLLEKLQSYFGYDIELGIDIKDLRSRIINRNEADYITWLLNDATLIDEPVNMTTIESKPELTIEEVTVKIENQYKLDNDDTQLLNKHIDYLVNWIKKTPHLAAICILNLDHKNAVKLFDRLELKEKVAIVKDIVNFKPKNIDTQIFFLIEALEKLKTYSAYGNIPSGGINKATSLLKGSFLSFQVLEIIKEEDANLYKDLIDQQYAFKNILNLNYDSMVKLINAAGLETFSQALMGVNHDFLKYFQKMVHPMLFKAIKERMIRYKSISYEYECTLKAQEKVINAIYHLEDIGEIMSPTYTEFTFEDVMMISSEDSGTT